MLPALFMLLDVEAIGLHGESFAYGYTVIDRDGTTQEEKLEACSPDKATGSISSRMWVADNIPTLPSTVTYQFEVLERFWSDWVRWKKLGAVLVADCPWPVEANFLSACVKASPTEREYEGPYPLYDLGSMLLLLGQNPLETFDRLPEELPAHNPLNDARQSARILATALKHAASEFKSKEEFAAQLVLPV